MQKRFYLYQRGGVFYTKDSLTGKKKSLKTRDRAQAQRLFHAKNEAQAQPSLNLHIARTYLAAADPETVTRTWGNVFDEILKTKQGETQVRWERAAKDSAFGVIRGKPLFETRSEHFLRVLEQGTVATNVFLRRLHNFALDMNWLLAPVLPRKQWPAVRHKTKRAITWEEHLKIIDGEHNPERAAFYDLIWHLGHAQSDVASLHAEDIDWNNKLITFHRKKIRHRNLPPVRIAFGSYVASTLEKLPKSGALFPNIVSKSAGHRATEFKRCCRRFGLPTDITLHCYRNCCRSGFMTEPQNYDRNDRSAKDSNFSTKSGTFAM